MPARGCDRLGPDREALDIERMRALRLQHASIHDHPRRAASLTDGEGRDDDIGDAAILLDRALMADERNDLAFDRTDAAEAIAAKGAVVGGRRGSVAVVAVGKQPVVDAVACGGRRREDEIAALGPERRRGAFPLDQNVRPLARRCQRDAEGDDDEAERAGAGLPQADPQAAQHDEDERLTGDAWQHRHGAGP